MYFFNKAFKKLSNAFYWDDITLRFQTGISVQPNSCFEDSVASSHGFPTLSVNTSIFECQRVLLFE